MLISAEFLAGGNVPMKSCIISSYFLCTNITILEYETHQKSYNIRKCNAIIWIRGIEELNFQDVLSTLRMGKGLFSVPRIPAGPVESLKDLRCLVFLLKSEQELLQLLQPVTSNGVCRAFEVGSRLASHQNVSNWIIRNSPIAFVPAVHLQHQVVENPAVKSMQGVK